MGEYPLVIKIHRKNPVDLLLHVKRGIHKVNIFLIQLLTKQLNGFAESLEMDDFPFPKELDHIIHIRIIAESENVIISGAGFLFRGQIFSKIRNGVALNLHAGGAPREPGGGGGEDTCGMIHEVGCEGGIQDLRILQISGQLMDDGADHL